MVCHGLRAVRIPNERRRWNFQLGRKPLNERFDRLFQLRKRDAWVTK